MFAIFYLLPPHYTFTIHAFFMRSDFPNQVRLSCTVSLWKTMESWHQWMHHRGQDLCNRCWVTSKQPVWNLAPFSLRTSWVRWTIGDWEWAMQHMEYQVYQSVHLVYTALSVWLMNKLPTLAANSSFHGSQNQEIEDKQSMRIQNTNNYLYWDGTSLLSTVLLSDANIMYKPSSEILKQSHPVHPCPSLSFTLKRTQYIEINPQPGLKLLPKIFFFQAL